jgi:hypothetical protein
MNVFFFIEPPPSFFLRVYGNSLGDELNIQERGVLRQEEKNHTVGFPLLARQLHIQRNSQPDRSFRTLTDAAIAVPAGFRIRNGREIAFGGAKVDIFGADVHTLAAFLTYAFIDNRGHGIAPILLLLSTR